MTKPVKTGYISSTTLALHVKSRTWIFKSFVYPEPGWEMAQYITPSGYAYVDSFAHFSGDFETYTIDTPENGQ